MEEGYIPYFSLIIPTHNRPILLRDCLDSILHQKYTNFEIILIDDGTNDDAEVLCRYINDNRIKYYKNKGKERSAARNTGLELAVGNYICFVDDDDLLSPYYLQDFFNYYKQNSIHRSHILRTRFVKIDNEGNKGQEDTQYDIMVHKNPVIYAVYNMCGMTTVCIPKEIALSQRFLEDLYLWEDSHYLLRIFENTNLIQLPAINYFYRVHPLMTSKSINDTNIVNLCNDNINAIDHYFKNYKSKYIGRYEYYYLKGEKYLEYALIALKQHNYKIGFKFFINSLNNKFTPRYYKLYYQFCKEILKSFNRFWSI